jgi:hypothetical protein
MGIYSHNSTLSTITVGNPQFDGIKGTPDELNQAANSPGYR